VFTAASKDYAKAIVDKLNKRKPFIKDILHREHCLETKKGRFIKDLRIIKNRSLKDIVLIDNLVESFCLQINNGIPILEFNGSS
jgi:CTD small phosphatase-like protein 2